MSAVRTPELRAVPAIAKPARTPEPSESANSGGGDIPDLRIGNFDRPDEDTVPEYEILEREPADRDGAHAVRLLVDSRARTQADYEVIARDLKARYADYDAVSVEFTDTRDVLDYRGAALIFNTPAGVYYMGYIYGPPKTKGYYVRAAE
ncbi:MAG: hypothetical protein H0U04_07860 [Rubrobacter sp.]|nr:hypothetical protein [Rubrobacter sp.]